MTKYEVVLRRRNGRFVKATRPIRSKYRAKKIRDQWEDKYDEAYYVEIQPIEER